MKSNKIDYSKLADEIDGFWTIETLCEKLKISRNRAIHIIHKLREKGYVKTSHGAGNKRIYYISKSNRYERKSYTDRINEASPIQLASWTPHYVYGKEIKCEEALIYALKKRDVRYAIASLALFNKIKDWSLLYNMAKNENLVLEMVVLYEVARKTIKKLKKMPKKYYNLAKKHICNKYKYFIEGLRSDSFEDIENKWKIYIPLNASDLAEYRGIKT